MKNILLLAFYVLVAAAMITSLSGAFNAIPPVGDFLDPANGLYYNARHAEPEAQLDVVIPGLHDEVLVLRDERSVPHIFAADDLDAVAALGYVVAADRLFQIDFVPRVAAGRLSEILGPSMVGTDRFLRQTGMEWGAKKNLRRIRKHSKEELAIIDAYVRGVNAYIGQLEEKDYPVEFKLMGYAPEPYTEMHVLRILQYMTLDLTYGTDDAEYGALREVLGEAQYRALFPRFAEMFVPVIPEKGGRVPSQEKRLVYPRNEQAAQSPAGYVSPLLSAKRAFQESLAGTFAEGFIPGKGSNNWAVGPERSTTGMPILAGDMHLSLWLPSIWYEVHMVSPHIKTYGVTIPGAPLPVEGFNDRVGWAFTNGGTDQIDHLKLTLDETGTRYLYNGEYRDLELAPDTILVKGKNPVHDTLYYAHWGPVTITNGEAIALQWVAHDSSRTLLAQWGMNQAGSMPEFQEALRYWDTPMQNIIYGDVDGNIAIRSTGYLPVRKAGRGDGLLDGSTDEFEWVGRVPFDELPYSFNPPGGYLSSTNQQPADSLYPYYLGHDWRPGYRSLRIDALLDGKELHSVEDMKKYQSDVYVVQRDIFASLLEDVGDLGPKASELKQMLLNWEGMATADRPEPLVMDIYLENLRALVWDEPVFTEYRRPSEARLHDMLVGELDPRWLDLQSTPAVEGADDIMRLALEKTATDLEAGFGWGRENWRWGEHHKVIFRHLTRSEALKGFWRGPYEYPGFASTLSPARDRMTTHSASWRMVVDFSTQPPAGYGVYPGGQSGNPFSQFYDGQLETYLEFNYYTLYRPDAAEAFSQERITSRLRIYPE